MKKGAIYTRERKISDGIFEGKRKKRTEKFAPIRTRPERWRIVSGQVCCPTAGGRHRQIAEALLLYGATIGQHISEYKRRGKLKNESEGSSGNLSSDKTAKLLQHLSEKYI